MNKPNCFRACKTAAAAASWGCFNCSAKLDAKQVVDAGYPPGRGKYSIRCGACGMSTFFDLKVAA